MENLRVMFARCAGVLCQIAAGACLLIAMPISGTERGISINTPIQKPPALYDVTVEKRVMIEMRDGIKLATALYRPVGFDDKKLPVILIRTPYGAHYGASADEAKFFAGQGYIVAVQDKRGRWDSEGEYRYMFGDRNDGYDTVEWLGVQPWSSGKVGMYGCSYDGVLQNLTAAERPPHLAAIVPKSSGSTIAKANEDEPLTRYGYQYSSGDSFSGGVMKLATGAAWKLSAGYNIFYTRPAHVSLERWKQVADLYDPSGKIPKVDVLSALWTLPVLGMLERMGAPHNDFDFVLKIGAADPYWREVGYRQEVRIAVPALHVSSWYDSGPGQQLWNMKVFAKYATTETAARNQYAIIGPTGHCKGEEATANTIVGERPVGDGRFDYWHIYLDWFATWLKGEQRGIDNWPRVSYYLMGAGEWRTADDWPIPETQYVKYFFNSDGDARSLYGNGKLSTKSPRTDATKDTFTYDPATPVPTYGGALCCIEGVVGGESGSYDQRIVEARADVLVYTSEVLEKDVSVVGDIEAVLYVSSSAKDTDFTVKLVDVYPDGRAFAIQDGILRARFREGFDRETFMTEGGVYKLHVSAEATANMFPAGHRIRVEIASSNFPKYVRNLNTGGRNYDETHFVTAYNTLHHGKRYPSHILLPVIDSITTQDSQK